MMVSGAEFRNDATLEAGRIEYLVVQGQMDWKRMPPEYWLRWKRVAMI